MERDDGGKTLSAFGQVDDVAIFGRSAKVGDVIADLTQR
jgi:hypothetical protein